MKRVNEFEGETEIWLENGRKINGHAWTHYVNNENWPVDAATARLRLRHRHITQTKKSTNNRNPFRNITFEYQIGEHDFGRPFKILPCSFCINI